MAPMINEQFTNLLDPILSQVFWAGHDRVMEGTHAIDLYNIAPSSSAYEYAQSLGALGKFEERVNGGPVNKDNLEELFKTTFTNKEYQKTVPIDANLIADQNYMQMSQLAGEMGWSAASTRLEHAASVFSNAFSSSYLGGDSKALCADDHPLDSQGSNSADNAGSSALSYDAVIATRALMKDYRDSRNRQIMVMPDTLLVPFELEDEAWEIANSIGKPDTANNNANFLRGINVVTDPFLTDATDWFLIDSVLAKFYLLWFEREPLNFSVNEPDAKDRNYYIGAYMRYSYGWSDWRWVFGHSV